MAELPPKVQVEELANFVMFGDKPIDGATRVPRLAFAHRAGKPRITVFTNSPNDTVSFGMISAPMDPNTFFTLLELISTIADGPNDNKYKVENYTGVYNEGVSTGEKQLLSETFVGKDADGVMWICVASGARPKIKFEFTISDYHKIFKATGEPLTKAEASVRSAKGTVKALQKIFAIIVSGYRPTTAERTSGVTRKPSAPPAATVQVFDDSSDIPF